MKAWIVIIVTLTLAVVTVPLVAQQSGDDRRELAERLRERYKADRVSNGVVFERRDGRERREHDARDAGWRTIEVREGTIAVDGETVTGSELRKRLGTADADLIIRFSYLSTGEQHELVDHHSLDAEQAPSSDARDTGDPPLERADSEPAQPDQSDESRRRARRANGDRVRIFGDVTVEKDEEVTGQVVAVLGSVRVDGEVGGQVVAVMGSVNLGPDAIVRSDVVSVGGRVRRAPGAQIRGGVTEVALADGSLPVHPGPWAGNWGPFMWFDGFGALPRLLGTGFRLVLLLLLTGLALVVAGRSVEASAQRVSDSPLKTTVIGLVAEILIPPVLFITGIVLLISLIGIPLLLLLPFVVLFLLLMALVGFAGAAAAIGRAVQRRFALGDAGPFATLFVGVLVVLSPLIVGRIIALAGWPATPFSVLLVGAGFALELLVWASGFGAVLTNTFTRMQAQRAARNGLTPPPVVP